LILIESRRVTITSALMSKLMQDNIVVMVCDEKHNPNGIMLSYLGHCEVNNVIKMQVNAKSELKIKLWQSIVKQKLLNQASHLKKRNIASYLEIENLVSRVKNCDENNCEAVGASYYFSALFGKSFSRELDIYQNWLLNYGYTLMRSCMVRAIVQAGMMPLFGIFHDNQFNNFNLADDLMECYRIFVDDVVCEILKKNKIDELRELKGRDKARLFELFLERIEIDGKRQKIKNAIEITANSFKASLESKTDLLKLPIFKEET